MLTDIETQLRMICRTFKKIVVFVDTVGAKMEANEILVSECRVVTLDYLKFGGRADTLLMPLRDATIRGFRFDETVAIVIICDEDRVYSAEVGQALGCARGDSETMKYVLTYEEQS